MTLLASLQIDFYELSYRSYMWNTCWMSRTCASIEESKCRILK